MELESKKQARIIRDLEKKGWYVIKLIQTNKNGIPDILAIHATKGVKFIEVKRDGEKPRPLQDFRINELKKLNIKVEII